MKINNLYVMATITIICMLLWVPVFDAEIYKVACILAAAAVSCVYMLCESRVQRANAPLVIREEPQKPPEGTDE